MSRIRVFVDTNIISEAYRTGHWKAICNHFTIETVEACVTEALAERRQPTPRSEQIPGNAFSHKLITRRRVVSRDRANWKLRLAGLEPEYRHDGDLGDGERDLLAWLGAHEPPSDNLLLATADRLALEFAHQLGWSEYTTSLEEMIRQTGRRPPSNFRKHYRKNWLLKVRSDLRAEGSR